MLHSFLNSPLNASEWSGVSCRRLNLGEKPGSNQLHRRIRGPRGLSKHFAEEEIPTSDLYLLVVHRVA